MITSISSVPGRVMSLIRSAFLWLMITITFRRKSMPQYVGPKVVAINRYSRPTMKPMLSPAVLQYRMHRMEPELTSDTSNGMTQLMPLGATAAPDTGSEDEHWNQLPWFPKPQPEPKTNGSVKFSDSGLEYFPNTITVTAFPDAIEIIPGHPMTWFPSPDAAR
jgi:hypothetical protein